MSKEFDEYSADKAELNLMTKEDVSLLKIKVGKNHRKEVDWDIIKKILLPKDVLTAELMKNVDGVYSLQHVLCEGNALVVFTNIDDCQRHMKDLCRNCGLIECSFQVGSLPFEQVVWLADENEMDVYIDIQDEANSKCIVYFSEEKQLKVVMLDRI